MTTKFNKKFILGPFLMVLTAVTLVACGDTPTATPAPVATTAAASTTAAAAGSNSTTAASNSGAAPSGTPGAGTGRGQGGGFGGGFNVVTGTVQTYDSTSKSLTVQESSGTSQTFDASNAVINKNSKLALADLSKENLANDLIQITGEKGSDGTYTATAVSLTDTASMANNGGFPGAGANGTPRGNGAGANGTPGAGRRNANGTPGANSGPGAGGFGGGNRLILRSATLSGNTLTGTDQTGASVTVNLSDSTNITLRTGDTATDLTAGAKISVNFRPAQNNGPVSAVAITIEQ
jgi:hypothetical protein